LGRHGGVFIRVLTPAHLKNNSAKILTERLAIAYSMDRDVSELAI